VSIPTHSWASEPISQWAANIRRSPMQQAFAAAADPEVLSLSLGLPDPELFPVSALSEASERTLYLNRNSLQYTLPCEELKRHICCHMSRRNVECSPDNILLTSGAMQGLSLLARLLLDPGDLLMEEEFSYPAFQQAVDSYFPRILSIQTDSKHGIDVDAVTSALSNGTRPAFLYLIPDGHNPLGATIPRENRHRLAQLAREFCLPIIEDDAYGFLHYDDDFIPPIRALESDWVYYVGSFSKILAPSLRIGWLVVPSALIEPLSVIKERIDLDLSTFSQWIVASYLQTDALLPHTAFLCSTYRERRDAMDNALRETFPAGSRWEIPRSGFFFWVDLPNQIDATQLLTQSITHEHVAFLPGEAFTRSQRKNGMRLNFTRWDSDKIGEGITRIARALDKYGQR
jgi:2-aminoadipate transaminase